MGKKIAITTILPVIILSLVGVSLTAKFRNVRDLNEKTKSYFDTDAQKDKYPNFYNIRDALVVFYIVVLVYSILYLFLACFSDKVSGKLKGLISSLYFAILIIFGVTDCLYIINPEEKISLNISAMYKNKQFYDSIMDQDFKSYYRAGHHTLNWAIISLIGIEAFGFLAAGLGLVDLEEEDLKLI